MEKQKKQYEALSYKVRNEVVRWTKLGIAFENDTNIKLVLDCLPTANPNGEVYIYLKEREPNVQKENE